MRETPQRSLKGGLILFIYSMLLGNVIAQDLPQQMHFSDDGERLLLGGVPATGFYDPSVLRDVYLDFEDPGYWQFMHDNFGEDVYALATLRYEDLVLDSVGVAFKGQTSYTKAIETGTQKLSFSIKLDLHIEGQDIDGYNNLNFNNAYGDDSYMIEVLYGSLCNSLVPALKGNFIRLWLNGEDWGIYPNIQQLNGDFIKEWFPDKDGIRWRADTDGSTTGGLVVNSSSDADASSVQRPSPGGGGGGSQWGDGTAALNYHGEDTSTYQQYYTLKDSDMDDPWTKLVKVCQVLNETPLETLADSLSRHMNLDATLWFLAQENLFSDDDSYVLKGKMDYYLYLEESTGWMYPQEFDGNSAMNLRNVSWSPFMNADNANYPLLSRLLAVPELRQRYIAHMKTLLSEACNAENYNALIDSFDALIGEGVVADPVASISAAQYNTARNELGSFLQQRMALIMSNTEFSGVRPDIDKPLRWVNSVSDAIPDMGEECAITAAVSHTDGISSVWLHHGTGLNGPLVQVEMKDDGIAPDVSAGDGTYAALMPGQTGGTLVRYYIEARAGDASQTTAFMPVGAAYDVFAYQVGSGSSGESDLVINEFLASNSQDMADEAGEYDDWIEIHNRGVLDMDLGAYFLSDDVFDLYKWQLPEMMLPGGDYLVIWADKDEEQGPLHASFKLSADGESVVLSDSLGNIIDIYTYGPQESDVSTGRWPNATGPFMSMETTFEAENTWLIATGLEEEKENAWRVYPNPCTDRIFIELSESQSDILSEYASDEQTMVSLYNAMGQRVLQEPFVGSLDVSSLNPGIYVLRVGAYTAKIQKQ